MKYFLFIERESGEEFIVEARHFHDALTAAEDIAYDIAECSGCYDYELDFIDELSEEEAEASGLDEY